MCTSHPRKGDLKQFDGLTAEEEQYHEPSAHAQLAAILNADKDKHVFFSPELKFLADPEFVASPPPSPAWSRQKKKKTAPPWRKAAPQAENLQEGSEQEEEQTESRNMADMASLWAESDED